MAIDFLEMNAKAIEEFRANDGECGPPFEGTPIVLVTMIGAKSGRELCSPLAYSTDGDDLVVIASMGGAPNNPNWYTTWSPIPTCSSKLAPNSTRQQQWSPKATNETGCMPLKQSNSPSSTNTRRKPHHG